MSATMPPIEWVDEPPPEAKRGGRKDYDWKLLIGFLMAHPGKWARLDVAFEGAGGGVVALRLNKAEGVDAVQRHGEIYVRYIAPSEQETGA